VPLKQNQETNNYPAWSNAIKWEKRSINYGASWKSVLFKGMPDLANEHFHSCHINFILECIKNNKDDIRILDIGCGYGRLSLPIIQNLPQAQIIGLDISANYVNLYKENTGRDAFVGTLESLPSGIGTFDYIIVVTVLMYLPKNNLKEVFFNLFSHLNKNGKIIIIEPAQSGIIFQTGFGLAKLLHKDNSINTAGTCFSSAEIPNLVHDAGGIVIREQRIPATTFLFLLIYLIAKTLPQKWTHIIFRSISVMDGLLKRTKLPTLWAFYWIGRK
jgi:2-polyprenyl-3-methyl-5-hydroxy-6-metoxy-1,4-benzoquinol methylase